MVVLVEEVVAEQVGDVEEQVDEEPAANRALWGDDEPPARGRLKRNARHATTTPDVSPRHQRPSL